MVWWAYIIVWVVSYTIPYIIFFILTILDAWVSYNKEVSESYKTPIKPMLEIGLCSILATLNCIFCAILFGLK